MPAEASAVNLRWFVAGAALSMGVALGTAYLTAKPKPKPRTGTTILYGGPPCVDIPPNPPVPGPNRWYRL